jgi:riboflavin kinase/FMN adenylyltransferase
MDSLAARAAHVGGTPTVVTFHPHPLQVLAPGNAPRMLQTLEQRLATIASLGIRLTVILPFDQEFARISARDFAVGILWERLQLHEVHVGPSFAFGYRREGSFNLLREIGAERGLGVFKIPQVQFRGSRVSSTAVRQALMTGQAALARRLLGRSYAMTGEVVRGASVGSGIRVPTANLQTQNELTPRGGVYVSRVTFDEQLHCGVTNIGVRPTVTGGGAEAAPTIETHILDFEGSIYGSTITLEFLLRLRDERRFPDKDALAAQIRKDVGRARRYFDWLERHRGHHA